MLVHLPKCLNSENLKASYVQKGVQRSLGGPQTGGKGAFNESKLNVTGFCPICFLLERVIETILII